MIDIHVLIYILFDYVIMTKNCPELIAANILILMNT